jgi:hypothetical protein
MLHSRVQFLFGALKRKMPKRTPIGSLAIGVTAILLGLFFAAWYTLFYPEGFGSTSPGTMVQLATSHVPTEEDVYYYRRVYPKLVRREITELTGSDPGVLRPWVFPRASAAGNTLLAW